MHEKIAVIRPSKLSDLKHFQAFAQESGPGITSLPRNTAFLTEMLSQSERSFSSQPSPFKKEPYLFCLELDGEVIGSSGLMSRIGVEEPFFAYHKQFEKHHSSTLNFDRDIPVLYLIEARKKPTEIGTLYLQKAFRGSGFGTLLSLSRFVFIKNFRDRFASTVITELRGVNSEGISPFWEAIGRHFFGLDFSEADHLRVTDPMSIEQLLPRHPIYTILLPLEAQSVISTPHPRTIPAKKILEAQGFKLSEYLDIFDGGPHLYAETDEIHAVKNSQRVVVHSLCDKLLEGKRGIVANTKMDYRATLGTILVKEGQATLSVALGNALNVERGEEIIYYEV